VVYEAYEWTHRHFPNFVDCRPIFVSQVIAAAGFHVTEKQNLQIWVPMQIVAAHSRNIDKNESMLRSQESEVTSQKT
jgi:demethylmenaquinone methyltransferase/2-methoxy-6-polyprenyl-1,4-benzoquinol methylase